MYIDARSTWFTDLSRNPSDSLIAFKKRIALVSKQLDSSEMQIQIDEIISITGILNRPVLQQLFPESVNKFIFDRFRIKEERFQEIKKHCLEDFQKGKELKLDQIKHLYKLSVFSTDDTLYNVIKEVSLYLLSLSMPTQECKMLGFYSVISFKTMIDTNQQVLMDTIHFLFEMTVNKEILEKKIGSIFSKQVDSGGFGKIFDILILSFSGKETQFRKSLNLEQEKLLFKYSALQGHGLTLSWGHFFISWAEQSAYGKPFLDLSQTYFCFDKIFQRKTGPSLQKCDLSAQKFLIQNTINIFFKLKPALPSGEWKEPLRELFLTSEAARQDVMFFIDYMNNLSKLAEAFPFTETLSHLQSFFPDQTSISYSFLHASLHFFCGCSLFSNSVNKDPTSTFKRIYRMSTEERQFLDEYISTQKSIADLLLTEFPNSPEKNRLKKELIQFLGESAINEINMTLDLLPGFIDDRNGKVLSYYSKFIQLAVKTQNENELAIKNGNEPDIKGFIELETWQKKLDILLEQINVKKCENKEINLIKNKIFEECQRTYSLATSLDQWKNSNKKDSDNFRALVKCDVWKVSDLQINQILDKLEFRESYYLTLSSEEIEIIYTVFNAKHIINFAEISSFLGENNNVRLKKLKILLAFSCFFRELENFKKSEIIAKLLKLLRLFNLGDGLEKKLDCLEEEQNENRQLLIYYLKSFQSNSDLKDELKTICKQEDYPLTVAQREDISILTNDKIDKIIEQNTLIINGSDPYSLFYINLAEELHEIFKESGTVDIIDCLPLPTLKQLKTALALIQTKMRSLLLATFTEAERIAVAQLLRIIMIGKEEATNLPLLTSDFAFTWKEASHYVLNEELFPLENMDIFQSLLNGGTLLNQAEKSRDQLLIQFFNDYVRGSTAGMYVKIDGKQEIIKHEKGKMFFESLREFYFGFLNNDIALIQEEIIYNKNNQDFISSEITRDQFKSILLKCCLSSQILEIEEIVQATTFTDEQMVWLKINSPDTDEQYLESLLRIKVLRCLVIWTQATTTIMLNQRIDFGLQDTNLSAISCKFSIDGGLHGTARGRKWVIDTSLNSMAVNLIIYLREVNEFFDGFVCTYSQVLSMTGITSNNREDSKVKLISLDTLNVSPFTQVSTFDKIALSLDSEIEHLK